MGEKKRKRAQAPMTDEAERMRDACRAAWIRGRFQKLLEGRRGSRGAKAAWERLEEEVLEFLGWADRGRVQKLLKRLRLKGDL